jgi:hypothetical protein
MAKTPFEHFSPIVSALSEADLSGFTSLEEKLRIAQDGPIEICYTPFELINPGARIVILGITPGRTQLINAVRELRTQIDNGANETAALYAAKQTGAFSGPMRPNLISMLNRVGIAQWLGLSSCEELFEGSSHLVQTTSALRNAVFIDGKNYNGTPSMVRHPLLQKHLMEGFGEDARAFPNAIFIPLGDKVAEALYFLADRGFLPKDRILEGLPHPSPANAERIAYFLGNKPRALLSKKTLPDKLDAARDGMIGRIYDLEPA